MTTKFEIGDKVKIVEKELPKTGMRTVAGDEYGRLLREYPDNTIMMRGDDTYAIITILYTEEYNSTIVYEVERMS